MGEYGEDIFSERAQPPRLHPDPKAEHVEMESHEGCAEGCEWAWMRRKRQDPEGFIPRGLALNKHRRNRRIEFWLPR